MTKKTIFIVLFAILMIVPAFAGIAEEVKYLGLSSGEAALSIISAVVVGLLTTLTIKICQKYGLEINDKRDDIIATIIWRGIGIAEEEGNRFFKKERRKMDGLVKYKKAIDYIFKEIDKSILPKFWKNKARDETPDRIAFGLGASRETFKTIFDKIPDGPQVKGPEDN